MDYSRDVALLISSSPLLILLWESLRGRRLYSREVLGAVIGLLGVAVIILGSVDNASSLHSTRFFGDLLALGAAAATATYAVVYQDAKSNGTAPKPVTVSLICFSAGGFILAMIAAFFSPIYLDESLLFTEKTLLLFLGIGIISTAVPSITYGIASKRPRVRDTRQHPCHPCIKRNYFCMYSRKQSNVLSHPAAWPRRDFSVGRPS